MAIILLKGKSQEEITIHLRSSSGEEEEDEDETTLPLSLTEFSTRLSSYHTICTSQIHTIASGMSTAVESLLDTGQITQSEADSLQSIISQILSATSTQ